MNYILKFKVNKVKRITNTAYAVKRYISNPVKRS